MADTRTGEHLATTDTQQGIWVAERAGVAGTAYHLPLAVHFRGRLDEGALREACAAVLDRHPVLSCAVEDADGVPWLCPAPEPPEVTVAVADGEGGLAALTRREVGRPFDLTRGPLARFTLVRLGPDRHTLLVVAHHLVFDGGSKDILVRDLAAAYRSAVEGGPPLPPGPAGDGGTRPDPALLAEAGAHWAATGRDPAALRLPGIDRLVTGAEAGGTVEVAAARRLGSGLMRAAETAGTTVFELLLATLAALLHRYGNAEPVVALDVGTRTGATRDRIGPYVNELPLALPRPSGSFVDVAQAVRTRLRELYRYREVPFARTVGGGRTVGTSLAPVSVSYRRRAAAPEFPGITVTVDWAMFPGTARGALHVQAVHHPDALEVHLRYGAGTPGPTTAADVAGHLGTLLTGIVAEPGAPVARLPLLSARERTRLLVDWNATATAYPAGATVLSGFDAWVRTTPDAVAVAGTDGRALTFAELDTTARRWAGALRAAGVTRGARVGIHLPRTPELVPALLATAMAGGAYVPLDPGYPADRLAHVAADAGLSVLLTATPEAAPPAPGAAVRTLADLVAAAEGEGAPEPLVTPDDLAYTIYTSGSTGRPKGVDISHGALANLLAAMRETLGGTPEHRWLGLTSLSFDIAALELFLPLVTGGRVVLVDDASTKDGSKLARLIVDENVTHVQATPSGWRMLLAAGLPGGLVAVAGGEALPVPLARELRDRVRRLVNAYGPTETTIWSTVAEVTPPVDAVTIGRPLANTRAYVLDADLNPAPVGVPGELYLAGAGLARGYHRRPGTTALRFVPDPFGPPGGRMYRTGDLVRYARDGRLEFLGRTDDQVKLRGHRIEPGEIEARLAEHLAVRQAAVALRPGPDGDRLVAYTVGGAPADELRAHLSRSLPAALVPGAFVTLERLPLTPNGKLDRAALPDPLPAPIPQAAPAAAAAPEDTLTEDVGAIWAEVLGLPTVGPDEDLFDLGGHSLTIMRIIARLRQRLGVEVPMEAFLLTPTVTGIVAAVREAGR